MLIPHQYNHLVTNIIQGFSARGREELFSEADNLPENNRLPTLVLISISHCQLQMQFPLLPLLFPSKRRQSQQKHSCIAEGIPLQNLL